MLLGVIKICFSIQRTESNSKKLFISWKEQTDTVETKWNNASGPDT